MTMIRQAQLTDLSMIESMATQLARAVGDPVPALSNSILRESIFGDRPWSYCLVAVDSNEPVGFVLLNHSFEAHTAKRSLKITDLFVVESARRSGVGQGLFEAVIDYAKSLDFDE